MLSLILFIFVVFVSFVIVRIGAIAFHLTGLDWSLSKFQALSCFSGTGFTTREAELIVGHPQRRRIASILMVLGNAGLVTLIASMVNSLRPHRLELPFLSGLPEWLIPWLSLAIIAVALYGLYRFVNSRAAHSMTSALRRKVVARYEAGRTVSFEELTITTGGYGVLRIPVPTNTLIVNKTLLDSGLKAENILVLAIVRGSETIPNPAVSAQIRENDELICFGRMDSIRHSALFRKKQENETS
jgi:Trk-type K+ transport system membrane component